MAGFCTQCGAALEEAAEFCGQCGARQETRAPAPASPSSAPAQKSGSPFLKIVAAVLGFFALVTVIGIGSCVYLGYRVKQKAEQYTAKAREVKETVSAIVPARTARIQSCPAVDPSESQAFRKAAASASIPLKPGLTLVEIWTAVAKNAHDIELLDTVNAIDDNTVTIGAASTETEQEEYSQKKATRVLCIADLLGGRQYETAWGGDSQTLVSVPETISGTTMFSMSQAVFQDMKAGRPTELEYFEARQTLLSVSQYGIFDDLKVRLTRVEPNDVPYSIIVNGERMELPSLHVKGVVGDKEIAANVLDDPANPITLNFVNPALKAYITYVKINFPGGMKIESDLGQGRCAAVYGIYFGFDSAGLRPESDPALEEIAEALGHNLAWKVKIEGHTDNIGGDAYNMTLSTRRAEAVKQAVVTRYGISSTRLSSEGFGASKPKAPNDTVEGRALNRRVELCRE